MSVTESILLTPELDAHQSRPCRARREARRRYWNVGGRSLWCSSALSILIAVLGSCSACW